MTLSIPLWCLLLIIVWVLTGFGCYAARTYNTDESKLFILIAIAITLVAVVVRYLP